MSIGANWADIWADVWDTVWAQEGSVVPEALSGGWEPRRRTKQDVEAGRRKLGLLPPEQEAQAVEAVQEAVLASVALTQSKPETQASTDALQAQRRAEEQFIAAYMAVYPQLVEAQILEALAMEMRAREEEELAMVFLVICNA